ncbi:MAG: DUF2065 domain-containing protein [Pelagibacteraceae bacterium]|jgi:uncharacterized protein YjeT (DUF2065 family)
MKEIGIAIGLLLVIEGLLYAVFPNAMKNMLNVMKDMPATKLRSGGLIFAVIGFILVWYIKKHS